MKKPKIQYKLWQEGEYWCCTHPDFGGKSFVYAKSPTDALQGCIDSHMDFLAFTNHIDGKCMWSGCLYCKEGRIKRF